MAPDSNGDLPLDELLGELPWFKDLTGPHRREMLNYIVGLGINTSRDEYATEMEKWSRVAHVDAKWGRFREWRENGFEVPYQRPDSSDPYSPSYS